MVSRPYRGSRGQHRIWSTRFRVSLPEGNSTTIKNVPDPPPGKGPRRMHPVISIFWRSVRSTLPAIFHGRRRTVARPWLELLERRVNLSTYIWTALGDGQTWNDANNWQLLGAPVFIQPHTVPTPYSDVVFPPIASLPGRSSSTINFNFAFLNMPVNSLTIQDSYTFTGNPVKIDSALSVASPLMHAPNGATATFLLAGLQLGPGVVINTAAGSTLQLAKASDPTGLQVTIQGPLTKSGGGQLVVDTQSVFFANRPTIELIPWISSAARSCWVPTSTLAA